MLDGLVISAGTGGGGATDTGGLVTITGGAGGGGGEATAIFCLCRARRVASNRSCSSLASFFILLKCKHTRFLGLTPLPSRALRDSSSGSTTGRGGGVGATRVTGVRGMGTGGSSEAAAIE